MNINKTEIQKILCIKPRGIGDILLSTIIIDNLNTAFPYSEIHYLTEEFAKRAVENNPFVKKVLTYSKSDFFLKTIQKIRKENYDLILDLWSNPRTAQITFFSGAKYRAGFPYRGRKYAYNIYASEKDFGLHSAETNLRLIDALGVPVNSKKIIFNLTEDEKIFSEEYFNENFRKETVIGIIPSGGWDSKRCEPEKWIEICELLLEKYSCSFLILWGPGDEKDTVIIQQRVGEKILVGPKTSIGEMGALISKCNLIIANDSGPMHIAAALNVPTIGLFGPTDPKAHGPFSSNGTYVIKSDLFCIICNKLTCPYNHECMFQLPVEEVLVKAEKLLKQKDIKV